MPAYQLQKFHIFVLYKIRWRNNYNAYPISSWNYYQPISKNEAIEQTDCPPNSWWCVDKGIGEYLYKKVFVLFLLRKKTELSFLTPIQRVDQYTTDVPSVVYWCGISRILIHTLVRRGSGGGRRLYPDGWPRKTAWFGNFVTKPLLGLLS